MEYDVIIIGSGPGGYVCAIRAAQLGLKTAIVEKGSTFGGTCLNIGCIPSKALLYASEMFEDAGHGLAPLGVKVSAPQLDLPAMMKHRQDTVDANVNGVAFLLKKNKVDSYFGTGTITASSKVEVHSSESGTHVLTAKSIVIATGSQVATLRDKDGQPIAFDEQRIVSSTGALTFDKVPKELIVVGAGVIGLELGSVWRRLGAKVIVLEYLDRIVSGMDNEVARQLQRSLEKQGIDFKLGVKVTQVKQTAKGIETSFEPVAGGETKSLKADRILIATGRIPFTEGLGLEAIGVAMERGRIVIDDHFETNVPGVYAIGDVVRGPMLAHKAEDEGVALAEQLAGQHGHVNYDAIPAVVYTQPEVASVGASEEELKAKNIAYKVGKFPFTANGRARSMRHTDGFVKVLADAQTDKVLGAHIIGLSAGEMIHELTVLMEFGGSSEDLARTCHAHPTLSEAVREAALAVDKRAIHM